MNIVGKTMTKSTITRERIEQYANDPRMCNINDEIRELARMALAAMDSEAKEPISFDEWSRKCALQITLCYPDFREKAQYIWDSARETQHVAPALFDDLSIFEAAIEECKTCDSIDEHAWNHGVLVVMAKYESCRAAMLKEENATKYWHGLYNEIKGRGRRHDGDFAPDLSMSTEEIINAIDKRRAGNTSNAPAYSDAEKRIADAVELLKKAAPAMLADNCDPDGPLAGRMKPPAIPDGYVMVPKEPTSEMVKKMRYHVGSYDRNIKDGYKAMLAAAPQLPGSEPATVPGKWIPVSERMPEDSGRYWCYVEEQNDLGKSHYQWNCSWNGERWWVESENGGIVTHWMPLTASPQEAINALISVVSRNEQEGK